jgi:hypothetical protein
MYVRDVLPSSGRSLAASAPRFNLVGLRWQGSGTPSFRTRAPLDHRWSGWQEADDDPIWTGVADAIQVRTRGRVTRLREYLLWSPPVHPSDRQLQLAGSPVIVSRANWQADETIRHGAPRYAPVLQLAVVHHTATATRYSCAQSASIVRGIEVFHVKANGWDDIGYNFLVDACGQVFEGRYGGIDRNVIGAHSGGFNTGTVGVSMIGNFTNVAPSKAQQDALVKLLAWRLDVAHVNPLSSVTYTSGGNSKFRAGTRVRLRAISAHRDTYLTSCPGNAAYRLLPAITARVAQTGLPKLYSPVVSGALGGPIRFTAKLSSTLPWTVTVADARGTVAATWSDLGPTVDWTWDSRTAAPGTAYTWTISAGSRVRAAVGVLGGKFAALSLAGLRVSPPTLDGGIIPTAEVTYTLSTAATVTADLVDQYGVPVATVFSQRQAAGAQSFVFTPYGVSDGNYTVRVTARDSLGGQVEAAVPVVVSHTLLGFFADTTVVSPNGDGRRDSATFGFILAQPAAVTLALASATASFPLLLAELIPGNQSFALTGTAADGTPLPDGEYQAQLTVGPVTQSLPLTIDRVPPKVSLVSLDPLKIRVTERVTVIATINGRVVRASVKPGASQLGKGVTVRTLRLVARDAAGNESLPITYPKT